MIKNVFQEVKKAYAYEANHPESRSNTGSAVLLLFCFIVPLSLVITIFWYSAFMLLITLFFILTGLAMLWAFVKVSKHKRKKYYY